MGKIELDFFYGKEAEQFTFYRLPKVLITDDRFRNVSNNAKLLYGLMLDRMSLSRKRGWIDDENRVFIKYSINNIEEDLNISKKTAISIMRELEEVGLIDRVQKMGVSNIIYVKNFVSENRMKEQKQVSNIDTCEKITEEKSEMVDKRDWFTNSTGVDYAPVEKFHRYRNSTSENSIPVEKSNQCNFDTITSAKNAQGPVEILHPSDIKANNKTNDINHINQSYHQFGQMDEIEAYMKLIKENIDYDIMMQRYTNEERDMYNELYQIICDVVCVPRKTILVGGEEYPYPLVKRKYLQLKSMHLEYVMECLKRTTKKIANIKSYLITALYNAPNTFNHYMLAEFNHDMYGENGS